MQASGYHHSSAPKPGQPQQSWQAQAHSSSSSSGGRPYLAGSAYPAAPISAQAPQYHGSVDCAYAQGQYIPPTSAASAGAMQGYGHLSVSAPMSTSAHVVGAVDVDPDSPPPPDSDDEDACDFQIPQAQLPGGPSAPIPELTRHTGAAGWEGSHHHYQAHQQQYISSAYASSAASCRDYAAPAPRALVRVAAPQQQLQYSAPMASGGDGQAYSAMSSGPMQSQARSQTLMVHAPVSTMAAGAAGYGAAASATGAGAGRVACADVSKVESVEPEYHGDSTGYNDDIDAELDELLGIKPESSSRAVSASQPAGTNSSQPLVMYSYVEQQHEYHGQAGDHQQHTRVQTAERTVANAAGYQHYGAASYVVDGAGQAVQGSAPLISPFQVTQKVPAGRSWQEQHRAAHTAAPRQQYPYQQQHQQVHPGEHDATDACATGPEPAHMPPGASPAESAIGSEPGPQMAHDVSGSSEAGATNAAAAAAAAAMYAAMQDRGAVGGASMPAGAAAMCAGTPLNYQSPDGSDLTMVHVTQPFSPEVTNTAAVQASDAQGQGPQQAQQQVYYGQPMPSPQQQTAAVAVKQDDADAVIMDEWQARLLLDELFGSPGAQW